MWEVWALVGIGLAGWFWYDSMKAREAAVRLGRQVCARDGLQFLDDTVHCARTRPARTDSGSLALRREYRFEFSDDGVRRRSGTIVMLAARVESLEMEPFLAPGPVD